MEAANCVDVIAVETFSGLQKKSLAASNFPLKMKE